MDDINKVSCLLCQRCEETEITGALSTKDKVTAHQNCLLFSSGLYCRNSPQFDDLFGFSVEDVLKEVKRGSKLKCNKCQTMGATAGCEVRRCKKSYHYPCAVQHRAVVVEDADQGKYGLYCSKHYPQTQENNGSVNRRPSSFAKSQTSKSRSEAGSSKVHCLACEKTEGNISLESLSNSVAMLYCNKHAPASHKRSTSGDSTRASSDSNSSSKRRLTFSDRKGPRPNGEAGM
ncbi:PHD finger protein 11-like isoform X3 [Cebidichthys violaceus]|uniref:PHD finger protein 11-like isoform X3 n=1 Tax=Cebidichthys violaceus TaxID=271503 RepID=UPI0035CB8D42